MTFGAKPSGVCFFSGGAFVKFLEATVSFVVACLSVGPNRSTLLPVGGITGHLISEYFPKNVSRKFKFISR
jgi:hypothetical protein